MLKHLVALLSIVLLSAACAHATPTSTVSALNWTAYTDANGVGFYAYWRPNTASSSYSNTNRVQIPNAATLTEPLSAVVPASHPASLCFVLTAYDAAGNESAFSNEACGFTGFPNPAGVAVK